MRRGLFAAALLAGFTSGAGCGKSKPHVVAVEVGGTGGAGTQGIGGAKEAVQPMVVGSGSLRGLRRLSNREYNNVVRDLLGDVTRPADGFIADVYQNGYDNGSAGLVVQSDHVESLQLAAETLAERAVATRLPSLLGGCDASLDGAAACLDAFVAGFAARAFRRPLTATEAARLQFTYAAGAETGGFTLGIQLCVEALLQSPQFLYREELGTEVAADPNPSRRFHLTKHEIASELAFLLTGSMPDDTLWAAVSGGRFEGPDDYRREALRLLARPEARDSLRRFLHQWLGTDLLPAVAKDAAVYPAFGPLLAGSMSAELDRDFDWALWGGTGSLRELFTSTDTFVDAPLAKLYGLPPSPTEGFAPAALDPATRKGILTRAGYLTVHSASDSSGPVSRGIFLLFNVLCEPPLQRPANIPSPQTVAEATAKGLTTRQRFAQHVSDGTCKGCHGLIDGVGFGFEEFDGIGAHRDMENGLAIDASGMLLGTGDVDGPFTGVSELSARIADSHRLGDCFVKQLYRFAMGRVETAAEAPVLAAISSGFSNQTRMTDLLLALVADPAFVIRTAEGARP